jgi:hypothetical protein
MTVKARLFPDSWQMNFSILSSDNNSWAIISAFWSLLFTLYNTEEVTLNTYTTRICYNMVQNYICLLTIMHASYCVCPQCPRESFLHVPCQIFLFYKLISKGNFLHINGKNKVPSLTHIKLQLLKCIQLYYLRCLNPDAYCIFKHCYCMILITKNFMLYLCQVKFAVSHM